MGIEPMSEAWKLSARHETFESAAFLTFFVFLKWIPFGAVADRVFKECKSVGDSRLQGRGPVQHPTMLNFLSNQRRCRLVIRAACCLNLISRLPFRPYCPLVPTCEPHKPLLAKWIWRKRVGVEPTIHPAKGRIAGFEDREDHRTPCASKFPQRNDITSLNNQPPWRPV